MGKIIANVVQAMSPGAVCVICTFSRAEAEAVVEKCKTAGTIATIYENPYYKSHTVPPNMDTYAQFGVVVEPLVPATVKQQRTSPENLPVARATVSQVSPSTHLQERVQAMFPGTTNTAHGYQTQVPSPFLPGV